MLGRAYIQSQSGQKLGMSEPSLEPGRCCSSPAVVLQNVPEISYPEKCCVVTDPPCTASIVIAFVVCLLLS